MKWHILAYFPPNRIVTSIVTGQNLYEAVDQLRDSLPTLPVEIRKGSVFPLVRLVNLHDEEGIRHLPQIRAMISAIRRGKDILDRGGIPNIKLFRDRQGRLVVFDGHHSLLAYMIVGRQRLREIPYILLSSNTPSGRISDQDIRVVFGPLASQVSDWRLFTINWQAPAGHQLTFRRQQTMGELLKAIKPYVQSRKRRVLK